MSQDEINQTKALLVEKFKASGEYDKMRAMIVASSLAALQQGEAESTFTVAPELTEAKEASLVPFQIVGDWLRALGLNYTFQVLAMEAGVDKKTLDAKRSTIAAAAGVTEDKFTPVLNQLVSGTKQQQSAPVATPAAVAAPAAAPVVVQPTLKILPTTKGAVPMKGKEKKAEETKYEIYFFEAGTFTRFNEIDDQPLQIADLKNCKIYCYDAVDCVTADACEDCEIVVAACRGSIFLRDCKNCKVTVACKQLRTRDCHDLDVRLYAMTDPVVESSSNVHIRPFNLRLPNLTAKISASGLDPAVNRFVHVYDFTPDAKHIAQPHFKVHLPDHGLKVESLGDDLATTDIPQPLVEMLEGRRQPTASSEEGPNKSHNIKTGSGAWSGPADAPSAPAAVAAPAAAAAAVTAAAKPAATTAAAPKPAANTMLTRDSDEDKYSDFSDDKDTPMSSVKNDSEDDEF